MGTTVAWKTHSSEEVHKLIQRDSVRILGRGMGISGKTPGFIRETYSWL
jgi:hypothetical protein